MRQCKIFNYFYKYTIIFMIVYYIISTPTVNVLLLLLYIYGRSGNTNDQRTVWSHFFISLHVHKITYILMIFQTFQFVWWVNEEWELMRDVSPYASKLLTVKKLKTINSYTSSLLHCDEVEQREKKRDRKRPTDGLSSTEDLQLRHWRHFVHKH